MQERFCIPLIRSLKVCIHESPLSKTDLKILVVKHGTIATKHFAFELRMQKIVSIVSFFT